MLRTVIATVLSAILFSIVNLPNLAIARGVRCIDRFNTARRILLPGEGYVDTNRLIRRVGSVFRLAHHHLNDVAVLPKVVLATQQLCNSVALNHRSHARDIDEIPLSNAQASEVFPAEIVSFALLCFLLLRGGSLLLLRRFVLFVLLQLFLGDVLEREWLVIVGSSTGGT